MKKETYKEQCRRMADETLSKSKKPLISKAILITLLVVLGLGLLVLLNLNNI